MNTTTANEANDWGKKIAELLTELSAVQSALLDLLSRKRDLVSQRDSVALDEVHREEAVLVNRLTQCCQQRQQLLDQAAGEGMPGDSLTSLAGVLPGESRERLKPGLSDARRQSRLLQHKSLANWVLVQRSLLHLSQLIEIVATGGRMQPTYGKEPSQSKGGALVDQAV